MVSRQLPLPGATNNTHTVNNATATGHAGAYAVALATPAGEIVTSGAFTVTVGALAAPIITAHPASQTVTAGQTVTFTVAATGQNLSYQWQRNSANTPGATSTSYTISNVQQSHAGNYSVRVSNPSGTATSNIATLTVNASSGGSGGGGGGGAISIPFIALLAMLLALRGTRKAREK